jgi:hypothetical protein
MEQHAASDATPAAVLIPGLAFETLLGVDLALVQWAHGQAVALAAAPPAASRQGKTPQHRLILVEQDNLVLACPIFESLELKAAIGQVCGVGIEPTGRATVAQRVFLTLGARFLDR